MAKNPDPGSLKAMGFLSLVPTQVPFFAVVTSSCGTLAWSSGIFRCWWEESGSSSEL